MCSLATISDFFNNQSVGAFIGAFFAFLLVWATDKRRTTKRISGIQSEFKMNLSMAKKKLVMIQEAISLIENENKFRAAPIVKFNTDYIKKLALDHLDDLGQDQRQAIEAGCYLMNAVDGVLDNCYVLSRNLTGVLSQADRLMNKQAILIEYKVAEDNINGVIEICGLYINKKYNQIVSSESSE